MTRAEKLYQQYLELKTLEAVGKAQEPPITRERVRQILVKAGYTQRNSHKIYTDEELSEHRKEYYYKKYWENPEESRRKNREYQRKWTKENPETAKERNRQSYLKLGKEENTRRQRVYVSKNREKVYARIYAWRKENPDKAKQYTKKWRDKNKEEINRKKREYYAKKKAANDR